VGVPISFAESVTAPAGTGTTLVPTIPSHQEDDVLILQAGWKGNQAPTTLTGWTLYFSQATGTATNGCGQGVWWRRVAPAETVTSPTLTIGATAVERRGIVYCIRGADIDNPSNTFWQKQQTVGNSATPTPPGITTLAPNYLLLHMVTCRGNSAITPPTGYNEEQDSAEGTTICTEGSTKTQTTAASVSGQAASISSNRWVAAIIAIPSPDYPYFRSQTSQTATATSITGTLPTGTTAADFYGRKDLIIATVEAAGTAPTPNVGGDWTEIATWTTTTSGGATSIGKYWALYDGSISLQFNRSGSGEISLQLCTYRNPHQTTPIGNVNVRQNASSTSGTWNALTRSFTKVTINASCVADATPTHTSPAGWTERSDGNGISTTDQIFEAAGSTASASFTLSTASPNAAGLVEIKSHASESAAATLERSAALDGVGGIASSATFFTILERNTAVSVTASVTAAGARVADRSAAIGAAGDIASAGEAFTLIEGAAALDASGTIAVSGVRVFDRSTETSVAASITVAAEFFSILERSVALDATASITAAGARVVDRSVAFNGTGAITVSGEAFTLFEAAAAFSTSAAIVSSGEFFSVLQTSSAVDAAALINVSGVRVVSAASMINAAGFVSVSGTVISGSETHERSVSFDAVVATVSSGLTIRERGVVIGTAVEIVTGYQRELLRAVGITATVTIAAAAVIDGGVVFNPTNVFNTDREMRILSISREGRIG
jgi:hypothetical protein